MTVAAAGSAQRTANVLRPDSLSQIVGQPLAKRLMTRAIESCHERIKPLEHTLIVAPSGTGKTTFAHAVANELGVDVYEVEAPVSMSTLLELRLTMHHGDILKIEEIHQQAIMERRGRDAATQPEVLYAIMEDRVMPTQEGMVPWPHITVMGTTTDEGRLPDAFLNRFPLRPRLVPYTQDDMLVIASRNAAVLDLDYSLDGLLVFAKASRGIPRELNNLMRNAQTMLHPGDKLRRDEALGVLAINDITEDGLTPDMQAMLTFLLTRAKHTTGDGTVKYQASVNTIATAIGKSRDTKAVALRVEPWLIGEGYVQVTPSGRRLTDAGITRAKELLP